MMRAETGAETAAPPRDLAALRDAATVVVLRQTADGPAVLMGQRGAGAAFMPSKFVFPGGAVDRGDGDVALARGLDALCAARLAAPGPAAPSTATAPAPAAAGLPHALAVAAIRELWEETGLRLAAPWPGGQAQDLPAAWQGFCPRAQLGPDAGALRFVFRAITPPGRPRRFDARFFLIPAEALADDLDDFSRAQDELSFLHWVPLRAARKLDLPFITEVVLAEVEALAETGAQQPHSVPFFDNSGPQSLFRRLEG